MSIESISLVLVGTGNVRRWRVSFSLLILHIWQMLHVWVVSVINLLQHIVGSVNSNCLLIAIWPGYIRLVWSFLIFSLFCFCFQVSLVGDFLKRGLFCDIKFVLSWLSRIWFSVFFPGLLSASSILLCVSGKKRILISRLLLVLFHKKCLSRLILNYSGCIKLRWLRRIVMRCGVLSRKTRSPEAQPQLRGVSI
jgi:hypothetical protein